jgi:hypothetical protein
LTFSVLPSKSLPLRPSIAAFPSESTLISTKAKPLACPVSRSVTTLTRSTPPYGSKIDRMDCSVVPKLRLPTKMFFNLFFFLICRPTNWQDRTAAFMDVVGRCENWRDCQIHLHSTKSRVSSPKLTSFQIEQVVVGAGWPLQETTYGALSFHLRGQFRTNFRYPKPHDLLHQIQWDWLVERKLH